MVDSAVLERMIADINNMQSKVAVIEQQNAQLKKQNIELVKDQRKLKDQTSADLQNAKKELQSVIREKETRLGELVKEEVRKSAVDIPTVHPTDDVQ